MRTAASAAIGAEARLPNLVGPGRSLVAGPGAHAEGVARRLGVDSPLACRVCWVAIVGAFGAHARRALPRKGGPRVCLRSQSRGATAQPRLVVGLGNPGERFRGSRHNAGFLAALAFAQQGGAELREDDAISAEVGRATVQGMDGRVVVIRPTTYMNSSGVAVGAALRTLPDLAGAEAADCLVLVDDVELPAGRLRLRLRGGSGGHNGLKSVERVLGTDRYPRLRIGVGRPRGSGRVEADHVIGVVAEAQRRIIEAACARAAEAAGRWAKSGGDDRELQLLMTWCNSGAPAEELASSAQ